MIIIVCAIIGAIIGLCFWIRNGCCLTEFLLALMMSFLGLLVGCVILLCVQPLFNGTDFDRNLVETTNLISFADNHGFEGSAFIFSSHVDSELQYTYLYESERGLTTKTIDADIAYLRYTNDTPIIEKYIEKHPNWWIHWLFSPGSIYYIIYIPEGSITTNQYNIDLQ